MPKLKTDKKWRVQFLKDHPFSVILLKFGYIYTRTSPAFSDCTQASEVLATILYENLSDQVKLIRKKAGDPTVFPAIRYSDKNGEEKYYWSDGYGYELHIGGTVPELIKVFEKIGFSVSVTKMPEGSEIILINP